MTLASGTTKQRTICVVLLPASNPNQLRVLNPAKMRTYMKTAPAHESGLIAFMLPSLHLDSGFLQRGLHARYRGTFVIVGKIGVVKQLKVFKGQFRSVNHFRHGVNLEGLRL